jgi:hypothetical protein
MRPAKNPFISRHCEKRSDEAISPFRRKDEIATLPMVARDDNQIRFFASLNMLAIALLILLQIPALSDPPATANPLSFATPKKAVQEVATACEKNDTALLLQLFGPESKDVVESGDPNEDKTARAVFAKLVHEKYKLVADPKNPDKIVISIGKDNWPFPIPLVRKNGQWSFDTAQGRQEILARRIGSNEMNAILVSHGYVEAQYEYAQSHKPNGVPEYAQKIASTPGKQDGLYWESEKGAPECDVPKGFAQAAASMSYDKRVPYRGYYFRILTAQGPAAPGGAVNYIVNGAMIGGFGLVAWPAEYGVSGIGTFLVDHDGTVYENDLGAETGRIAAEMTEFNPDKSWQPVKPE